MIISFISDLVWDLKTAVLLLTNKSLAKAMSRRGYRLAHKSPYEMYFVRGEETAIWTCSEESDATEISFRNLSRKLHVNGTFMGVNFFHDGKEIVGRGVSFYFG